MVDDSNSRHTCGTYEPEVVIEVGPDDEFPNWFLDVTRIEVEFGDGTVEIVSDSED